MTGIMDFFKLFIPKIFCVGWDGIKNNLNIAKPAFLKLKHCSATFKLVYFCWKKWKSLLKYHLSRRWPYRPKYLWLKTKQNFVWVFFQTNKIPQQLKIPQPTNNWASSSFFSTRGDILCFYQTHVPTKIPLVSIGGWARGANFVLWFLKQHF